MKHLNSFQKFVTEKLISVRNWRWWKQSAVVFVLLIIGYVLWSFFTVAFLDWKWMPWTGFGEYFPTKMPDGTEVQ